MTPLVDVLVPTCNRLCALGMTLTALAAQSMAALRIIVSDQSDDDGVFAQAEVLAVLRLLRAVGRPVETLRHMPRLGMAEHRAFLLSKVSAPSCLFLDDDVLVEPDLVARLHRMLTRQQCGFVGSAVHGLSYLAWHRPHEQHIEFWEGRVEPESVAPESPAWQRHRLHSAANLFHVQQRAGLGREHDRAYRVAWVGGCVLFDTEKLRATGGFDFWPELPPEHCGEDVLAQLRVMARFGGCGLIPSGAYHMELPTTVTGRKVDAPKVLLPEPACGCGLDHDCGTAAPARRGDGSGGAECPDAGDRWGSAEGREGWDGGDGGNGQDGWDGGNGQDGWDGGNGRDDWDGGDGRDGGDRCDGGAMRVVAAPRESGDDGFDEDGFDEDGPARAWSSDPSHAGERAPR